jgi:O-antigen ligase
VVPPQVAVLGRLTLWHAALGLFATHPLFGVGPDNFRLTYGPYVGEAHPDPRVHSNSMYFEWLTGAGLVGLLVFGWMLWRADTIARITRRSLTTSAASLYAGVAAAGVAVLVHGLVDSFLTFTPTYVAIALTLGLVAAPSTWTEVARARRV